MLRKNITSLLSIHTQDGRKYNFDRNFSFNIFSNINALNDLCKADIRKDTDFRVDQGDRIFIALTVNSEQDTLVFAGRISKIIQNANHMSLEACDEKIPYEVYYETFKQGSGLSTIVSNLGNISVHNVKSLNSQIVCRGFKHESFINILRTLEEVYKKPFYFSSYFESVGSYKKTKIVVRDSKLLPDSKLIMCDSYLNYTCNSLEVFVYPELRVGDRVKVHSDSQEYVVTSFNISNIKQRLEIIKV
ncbi:MAG: hypothetical protein ACRCTQ_05145 [Brevinemataceae bacterium]